MSENCKLDQCAEAVEKVMLDRLLEYLQEHKDELLKDYKSTKNK